MRTSRPRPAPAAPAAGPDGDRPGTACPACGARRAGEASASAAAALDLAAQHARARGSLDSAAELAELAVTTTPAIEDRARLRRTVAAAEYLFLLGDPARARTVVAAALEAAAPGPDRVPGLLLRARIASLGARGCDGCRWCKQALAEAGDDPLLLALSHATFAETSPSGAEADLTHAQSAVSLLQGIDSPPSDLLSNALTNLALHGCRPRPRPRRSDPGAGSRLAGPGTTATSW